MSKSMVSTSSWSTVREGLCGMSSHVIRQKAREEESEQEIEIATSSPFVISSNPFMMVDFSWPKRLSLGLPPIPLALGLCFQHIIFRGHIQSRTNAKLLYTVRQNIQGMNPEILSLQLDDILLTYNIIWLFCIIQEITKFSRYLSRFWKNIV